MNIHKKVWIFILFMNIHKTTWLKKCCWKGRDHVRDTRFNFQLKQPPREHNWPENLFWESSNWFFERLWRLFESPLAVFWQFHPRNTEFFASEETFATTINKSQCGGRRLSRQSESFGPETKAKRSPAEIKADGRENPKRLLITFRRASDDLLNLLTQHFTGTSSRMERDWSLITFATLRQQQQPGGPFVPFRWVKPERSVSLACRHWKVVGKSLSESSESLLLVSLLFPEATRAEDAAKMKKAKNLHNWVECRVANRINGD
jgi:hypothetical protein